MVTITATTTISGQTQDMMKRVAANAAIEIIKNLYDAEFRNTDKVMRIGLGTGSTVEPGLHILGAWAKSQGIKNIVGMSTSKKTEEIVGKYDIRTIPIPENPGVKDFLDIGYDGADFISKEYLDRGIGFVIKGGGAAQGEELRVARLCKQWIIIADITKMADRFNAEHWVPVEVPGEKVADVVQALLLDSPLPSEATQAVKIVNRGKGAGQVDRRPFADNGHPVIEAHFNVINEETLARLNAMVESHGIRHGLFYGQATAVIVADALGGVRTTECRKTS